MNKLGINKVFKKNQRIIFATFLKPQLIADDEDRRHFSPGDFCQGIFSMCEQF
jgi:hypothetical protein